MQVIRKYDSSGNYDNTILNLKEVLKTKDIRCALFGGFEEDEGWRRECMDELVHLYSLDYADRYSKDLIVFNPYILKEDIIEKDSIGSANMLSVSESIIWDCKVMSRSDILSFYISEKCTNAVTLFELGNALGHICMSDSDDRFKLIISINNNYPNLGVLYAYLEQIIGDKDALYSMVNCHATPKSHALAIYNSYKYFVNK